jgi:hypothetical protein
VTIKDTNSAKNGGIVYAIETTSPNSSSLNFINTATINNITSAQSGGSFYIDHSSLDIFMNTVVTLTSSKVTTTGSYKGGVFYINRGKKLEIQNSTFLDFSSASSGSFLYS